MPDDQKPNSYRIKLGPIVTAMLEEMDEQSAAALDERVAELLATEETVTELQADRQKFRDQIGGLADALTEQASALVATSTSVDKISHLVDHRFREMQKLIIHMSAMIGTTVTEGAERDQLFARSNEIFMDLGRQIESLSGLIKEQQGARQRQVHTATARAEDERLAIAQQNDQSLDTKPVRSKGWEH